jgi:hypothetical protein
MTTKPPRTIAISILVADTMIGEVIGRPVYCSHFRIDQRDDGFYELTVTQGKGDADLNRMQDELG